jgi:acyl carrier protein
VQSWLAKGKYGQVLGGWTRGMKVEWRWLYAGEQLPRRVPLPAYPFAKERYWVDERPTAASASMNPVDKPRGIVLTALEAAAPRIDRVAPPRRLDGEVSSAGASSAADITSELLESLAAVLSIPVADIDSTLSFAELGMDSVSGAQWSQAINHRFATRLSLAKLYQYPNIPQLAAYLASETRSATCTT